MQDKFQQSMLKAFGPNQVVAYVRWVPSSDDTQTLTEAFGVASVTRSGAGTYSVNLTSKVKEISAFASVVENATTFHEIRVTADSPSAGTISVRHRTCAYADIATGPTASDSVDEILVVALLREHD